MKVSIQFAGKAYPIESFFTYTNTLSEAFHWIRPENDSSIRVIL